MLVNILLYCFFDDSFDLSIEFILYGLNVKRIEALFNTRSRLGS
jgi:hypothetical protein